MAVGGARFVALFAAAAAGTATTALPPPIDAPLPADSHIAFKAAVRRGARTTAEGALKLGAFDCAPIGADADAVADTWPDAFASAPTTCESASERVPSVN